MQINATTALGALLVLSNFGLVSCGPDEKFSQDSFVTSQPKLVLENQPAMSWQEVKSSAETFPVTPMAQIKFGPEVQPGVKIFSETRCKVGRLGDAFAQKAYDGPSALNMMQLMPKEVLTANPHEQVVCSVALRSVNPKGSKHIYSVQRFSMMTMATGSNLPLKKNGTFLSEKTEAALPIPIADSNQFYVSSGNNGEQVFLQCEQHRLSTRSIGGGLISLNEFESESATSDVALDLASFPNQNCRVVTEKEGELKRFSQLINVGFQRSPVTVEWQPSKNPISANGTEIGQGLIRNTFAHAVTINFPKPGSQKINVRTYNNGVTEYAVGVYFEVDGNLVYGFKDLQPGEKITIKVKPTARVSCPTRSAAAAEGPSLTSVVSYIYATEDIGPDWIQTTASKFYSANRGLSSGVWPIVKKGDVHQAQRLGFTQGLDFEKIMKMPVTNPSACRHQQTVNMIN